MTHPKKQFEDALERGKYNEVLSILKEGRLRSLNTFEHPLLQIFIKSRRELDTTPFISYFIEQGMSANWMPEIRGESGLISLPLGEEDIKHHSVLKQIENMGRWRGRLRGLNNKEVADFINGGLLNWTIQSTGPHYRKKAVDLLIDAGATPYFGKYWSPVHCALKVGDVELAQKMLTLKPKNHVFDAESLAWSANYFIQSISEDEEVSKTWQNMQNFIQEELGDDALNKAGISMLERGIKDSSWATLSWMKTPWSNWKNAPQCWSEIWNNALSKDKNICLEMLDYGPFALATQQNDFMKLRVQTLPAWQHLVRHYLSSDKNYPDESFNDKDLHEILLKLEDKGSKPWLGTDTPEGFIPDDSFIQINKRVLSETVLKRYPAFQQSNGRHPGFAATTAEHIWVFKDKRDEWTQLDEKGNQLFASWVVLSLKDKKVANWIERVWNSKKIKAPIDGIFDGKTVAEWVAGHEKLSQALWKQSGTPNSFYALNESLENANNWGTYRLCKHHPHLMAQWKGDLVDQYFENMKSKKYRSWKETRTYSNFTKKSILPMVNSGWRPTKIQWLQLFTHTLDGKIPQAELNTSHDTALANALLKSLPDTCPVGFDSSHLKSLINRSVGTSSTSSFSHHQAPWWSQAGKHLGWLKMGDLIEAWGTMPDWTKEMAIESSEPMLAIEQGWSADEWILIEGWLIMEKLRHTSNHSAHDENSPKGPKMRL